MSEGHELPWYLHLLLFQPRAVQRGLDRVRDSGLVEETPNLWQITLGVLRMWSRVLFRSETVGMCAGHAVRPTLRARLLQHRPLRFPFLLAERAIAPLDFSGLASPPERISRHLLGAHHDERQFLYDLELLRCYPGWLEEVRAAAAEVVSGKGPQAEWLRDLTVYERYHENLLEAVEKALAGQLEMSPEEADDPDISFTAYLRWCARQPRTPAETWEAVRRGELSFAPRVPTKEARS
jgi:hypothetical protein